MMRAESDASVADTSSGVLDAGTDAVDTADAAGCRIDTLRGAGLATDLPLTVGIHCDEIDVCLGEAGRESALRAALPGVLMECGGPAVGCATLSCVVFYSGLLSEEKIENICTLAAIDPGAEFTCWIFGP